MSNSIFLILLFAALCHSIWNALGKSIPERDAYFTLILGTSVVLYAPFAIYLWMTQPFPVETLVWLVFSSLSEIAYFLMLAKAYRTADLSNAYPVLRGTAPVITTLLYFLLIGSAVSWLGLVGILFIVSGILFINQRRFSFIEMKSMFTHDFSSMKWIFLAGFFSATGNISDAFGVQHTSGILFKYFAFIGMFAGKWLIDRKVQPELSHIAILKRYPIAILIGGLFVFASNSLTTYCMKFAPVTYVSSVREVSIVFAALIGVFWLKEKIRVVGWISILAIVAGTILIKIG